jgi:glutamyl-tRNA synthetase
LATTLRFSKTRLAPSPTGALHLGNARTFLATWLMARQAGAGIVLRIEDIDGPRVKPEAVVETLDDLRWLGLDWDDEPILQSNHLYKFRAAANQLFGLGHAYYCVCSRKEVEAAGSAPHTSDRATRYPGTCRGKFVSRHAAAEIAGREPALRFRMPDAPLTFYDHFRGECTYQLEEELGDFVIEKGDGTPAYQLAVVCDDAESGVDLIVRGDDLLDSTPRQMLLYRALGFADRIPAYVHLPLMVGPDGRRLAKRHGDTRLSTLRGRGVTPGALLGYLAETLGCPLGPTASLARLREDWSLGCVPNGPCRVPVDIEALLLSRC